MNYLVRDWIGFALLAMLAVVAAAGCSPTATQTSSTPNPANATGVAHSNTANPGEEHTHPPGAHGGIIIPIGADSYHAEAVVEQSGVLRLFMLGSDETRIQEVDLQTVKAFVKVSGAPDAIPIELSAAPQDGDGEGKTSQFTGTLPESAIGQAIDVTIPNLRIGNERFRVGFTTAVQAHDNGMPAGVTGEEEQKLYFTAAGKYTEADIKANGNQTASAKFKGFMSKHDMNPKPGDFICPVTFTKANPKVAWQINGQQYLFCCPPCVDEFVRMAKEEPDSILGPEEYVQKEGARNRSEGAPTSEAGSSGNVDTGIAEAMAKLNEEDRRLAEAQKFCAVATSSPLGSMGTPIKLEIEGGIVFLCCEGCRSKALSQPAETLATATRLKQQNADK